MPSSSDDYPTHHTEFFSVNLKMMRKTCCPPAIPPEFLPLIGTIAMSWGTYEQKFDVHVAALLTASGLMNHNPKWETLNYGKRKDLFKKALRICYSGHPMLESYFSGVLDDSTSIQKDRNLIIHGKYAMKIQVRGVLPPLVFLFSQNRKITKEYDPETLEQLGYDIMHLAGRLEACFSPDGAPLPPPLQGFSSEDISLLREVLSKTPPTHSSLPTLPAQP